MLGIEELGRQPYTSRRFFLRYADRILFGTDAGPNVPSYRVVYRFLETDDDILIMGHPKSRVRDAGTSMDYSCRTMF